MNISIESRCGQTSTIFCSQFTAEGWHKRLGSGALANSILDRIVPSTYTMIIDGDVSLRQRKRSIKILQAIMQAIFALAPYNGSSGYISGGWVIEKYGMTKRL